MFRPDITASASGELTGLYLLSVSLAATLVFATYAACYFPHLRRLHRIRRR